MSYQGKEVDEIINASIKIASLLVIKSGKGSNKWKKKEVSNFTRYFLPVSFLPASILVARSTLLSANSLPASLLAASSSNNTFSASSSRILSASSIPFFLGSLNIL